MSQDLRELFKNQLADKEFIMKEGHEKRFESLLDKELPKQKRTNSKFFKVAAIALLVLSVGAIYLLNEGGNEVAPVIVDNETKSEGITPLSLGDLSPDLKKVEHYYVANINLALSKIDASGEHKELVDSYMARLAELNLEYQNLNQELNELGPNDQTIAALIKNLQLRLQLLQKLKEKLNEVQLSKNEQYDTNAI